WVERVLPGGNGYVVVDEAHSNGVYGPRGRGIVSNLALENRVFARLHTFGKGLACNGAALLCSTLTREYLINYAKPLIYSTSMSFPSLAAIKVVYSLMKSGATEPASLHHPSTDHPTNSSKLIAHLNALMSHFYTLLQTLLPFTRHPHTGVRLLYIPKLLPQSAIFALLTPEPRALAKFCQDGDIMVRPIVPPTVPEGTQRVRVCLHAGNTFEDVERLVARVGAWLQLMRSGKRMDTREAGLLKAFL
ncbi:8-amino-7-oxononanoate synthase, partial [Lachnellula suecica]